MAPAPPRSLALLAFLAQVIGVVVGFVVWHFAVPHTDSAIWLVAVTIGSVAALTGKLLFRLPNWWLPINALFAPAIVGAMALHLPAWIYLAAFVATLAVFWNVRSDRVPLYLTNRKTWAALSGLLPDKHNLHFVDLGSGLSGTPRYLARQYPDASFVGVESAPFPLLVTYLWQWMSPLGNAEQRNVDLWSVNLGEFDVVYCFLSPAPMAQLYEKAKNEMKPGSMLIGNSFEIPDHPPTEEVAVDDGRKTRLMIWRF